MRRTGLVALAAGLALSLVGSAALADFTPKFSLKTSNTKVKGNPSLDIHLEFDENDEEIGNFAMTIPKGFNIAADAAIENAGGPGSTGDEVIGGGTVTIEAGFACRPGPEGAIPASAPATIDATIYEKARTDEEADAGVHAVWLLDLEPLNRVRLLITGNSKRGWKMEGAPTPSDNTCNPLIVDLKINDKSESGVPLVTNAKKPGVYKFVASVFSQDSPSVAKFTQKVKLTK